MTAPMDIKKLLGARMTGPGGEELGTVEQIFFDDVTGVQEWARLRMGGGLLGGRDRFVPLAGASMSGRDLSVPYDKNKVKDSPDLTVERHITPEQEAQLRSYYGMEAGGATRTTTPSPGSAKTASAAAAGAAGAAGVAGARPGQETAPGTAPAGTPGAAGMTSGAPGAAGVGRERAPGRAEPGRRGEELELTRCEERIAFQTEEIEVGRVRLHKYVDVVPVEERVRLVHEEFELERLPLAEGAAAGDIREDSVEVVLRGQRAVPVKEIHPVERVRLNVKQVPEERVIRDEIRRERIEVEPVQGTGVPGAAPSGHRETAEGVDRSDEPPGPGRGRTQR